MHYILLYYNILNHIILYRLRLRGGHPRDSRCKSPEMPEEDQRSISSPFWTNPHLLNCVNFNKHRQNCTNISQRTVHALWRRVRERCQKTFLVLILETDRLILQDDQLSQPCPAARPVAKTGNICFCKEWAMSKRFQAKVRAEAKGKTTNTWWKFSEN